MLKGRAPMSARIAPLDGASNPNLPIRDIKPSTVRATAFEHPGPFDVIEMLGPEGEWIIARVPRHPPPKVKQAILRFRGPWKQSSR